MCVLMGGHKLDRFLTDTLGQYVVYVPVCPEVECGFGIPREAFRLVGDPKNPRLVTSRTNIDHTDRMAQWAQKRVTELEKENLCGYIFKSGSPSNGMERVKVYDRNNVPAKTGVGIFARIFMEHFPLLPVEDEGRSAGATHWPSRSRTPGHDYIPSFETLASSKERIFLY